MIYICEFWHFKYISILTYRLTAFQKNSSSCKYFNIAAAKNVIKIVLSLLLNILLNANISHLMHFTKRKIIIQLKKLIKKNRFAKKLALSQVMPEDLTKNELKSKKAKKDDKNFESN